jgi:hypothetical protein
VAQKPREPRLTISDVRWVMGLRSEVKTKEFLADHNVPPSRKQMHLRYLFAERFGFWPEGDWTTWRNQMGNQSGTPSRRGIKAFRGRRVGMRADSDGDG